jgi:hypothetical protein
MQNLFRLGRGDMKLVKAIPMPPYFYQEPEWLKPCYHRMIRSVSTSDVQKGKEGSS